MTFLNNRSKSVVQTQKTPLRDPVTSKKICKYLKSIDYDKVRKLKKVKSYKLTKYRMGAKVMLTGSEILNTIKSVVRSIIPKLGKIDDSNLLSDEKQRMLSRIDYFSIGLKKSLYSGDMRTADFCTEAIVYGVIKCCSTVFYEQPLIEREREIYERENALDIYKQIVVVSLEMDKLENTKTSINEKYLCEFTPRYEEIHEQFLKDKETNPGIYDDIVGRTGNELTEEHIAAWRIVANDHQCYQDMEEIKRNIVAIESALMNYEFSIIKLRLLIDMQTISNNSDIQINIDKYLSELPTKLLEVLTIAKNYQKSFDTLSKEIESVLEEMRNE